MEKQDNLPQKHIYDIHHCANDEVSLATQRQVSAKPAQRRRKFRKEFYCEICHKHLRSQNCYVAHISGKKHQKKWDFIEREQGKNFWCSVCYRKIKTRGNFENHCNAKGHLKRVHKLRNTIINLPVKIIHNKNLETCNPNYQQVRIENQPKGLRLKHERQGEEFGFSFKIQEPNIHSNAASVSDASTSRNLEQYDQCNMLPDEKNKRKRYNNDVNNSKKQKIEIKLETPIKPNEPEQRKESEEKPVFAMSTCHVKPLSVRGYSRR